MSVADRALLARRLARLRAAGGGAGTRPALGGDHATAPAIGEDAAVPVAERAAVRLERAQRLAAGLGGAVEHGPAGPIVVISASIRLPLARAHLTRLPYPIDPDRPLVCLDTETTGLGTATGTLPFLVGIGRWDGETFRTRQLFLPDQPDEPAFLAALGTEIAPDAWLVSYNGRTFDWPLLVTRYRLQRQAAPEHAGHLDLLPLARQLWRHRLPDARLVSVERGIVGVARDADLPSALIPERYFEYLRTGRSSLLREVAEHNRQDVVSLARLLVELATRLSSSEARLTAHPGDVGALGRAYTRRRRYDEALDCFETGITVASEPSRWGWPDHVLAERLAADRARVLARMGRHLDAAASWQGIAEAGGRLAAVAWLQLAKHREHRTGDLAGALQAADRAGGIAERARRMGWPLPLIERDLVRRQARLRRRLAATRGSQRAGAQRLPVLGAGQAAGEPSAAMASDAAPATVRPASPLPRLIAVAP